MEGGREVELRMASCLLGPPRAGPETRITVQAGNLGGGNSANQGVGK